MTLPDAIADIANQSMPKHVAIIMDGNGRWAQQRGKIRIAGHKAGVTSVRQIVSVASRMGIKALTLFAFSSENWRRPESEVSALMELFMFVLGREIRKLNDGNIRLRIIGDIHGFSDRLQKKIREAEGQAEAILKVQQANADAIKMIKEAGADEAVLQIKSLEAFAKAADGQATKIIIPSEIQGMAGLAEGIIESVKK